MEIYGEITKFLKESGKCLIIEDGKIIGVVLTMEEYNKLKFEIQNPKFETKEKNKEMDFSQASSEPADVALADDITLEDLGLDELPY